MTVVVGVRSTEGVVIGTDSAMTFGPLPQQPTIEQPFHEKIRVIGDGIIVASTGEIGLGQRFADVAKRLWDKKSFSDKNIIDVGRMLAQNAINDFRSTSVNPGQLGALVACRCSHRAEIIEFPVHNFQPDVKTEANWYVSMGSGQTIADPLLGFAREAFWGNDPPNHQEAIFAATMVLKLACKMSPFGVAEPIQMATLSRAKGSLAARKLTRDELLEHAESVKAAIRHFKDYRKILREPDKSVSAPPQAVSPPGS